VPRGKDGDWKSKARHSPDVVDVNDRLGERVRKLRAARELTQEDAADLAEVDGKHWQEIEGGRTNPTVSTLVGVAKALDVNLAQLFKGV